MSRWRLANCSAVAAIVILMASVALAQNANYTSVEATSDKPVQLNLHASARKDCTAGRLPTIRVIEPPKSGTMTVRGAVVTTNRVPGCPGLKTPARVVFYTARSDYVGPDHLLYEVTSENGEVATFDITITVKPSSEPPKPTGAVGVQPL